VTAGFGPGGDYEPLSGKESVGEFEWPVPYILVPMVGVLSVFSVVPAQDNHARITRRALRRRHGKGIGASRASRSHVGCNSKLTPSKNLCLEIYFQKSYILRRPLTTEFLPTRTPGSIQGFGGLKAALNVVVLEKTL
jgi:hypothetical protein